MRKITAVLALSFCIAAPSYGRDGVAARPLWALTGGIAAATSHAGVQYVGGGFEYLAFDNRPRTPLVVSALTGEISADCARITGDQFPVFFGGPPNNYQRVTPDGTGGFLLLVPFAHRGLADANGAFRVLPGQAFVRIAPDCRFDRTFVMNDLWSPGEPWLAPYTILRTRRGVWVSGNSFVTRGVRLSLYDTASRRRIFTTVIPVSGGAPDILAEVGDGRLLLDSGFLLDPFSGQTTELLGASGRRPDKIVVSNGIAYHFTGGASPQPIEAFDLSTAGPVAQWSGPSVMSLGDAEVVGDRVFFTALFPGMRDWTTRGFLVASGVPVTVETPEGVLSMTASRGRLILSGGRRPGLLAMNPVTGEVEGLGPPRQIGFRDFVATEHLIGVLTGASEATVPRHKIAAVDLQTREVLPWTIDLANSFYPNIDGSVIAVEVTDQYLYAGTDRGCVYRLSMATRRLTTWRVCAPNGSITSIIAVDSRVYIAGSGGVTGAYDTAGPFAVRLAWNPGGTVSDMVRMGNRIFLSGRFVLSGGQPRDGVVAVNGVTGELDSFALGVPQYVSRLTTDGTSLFFLSITDTGTHETVGQVSVTGSGAIVWQRSGLARRSFYQGGAVGIRPRPFAYGNGHLFTTNVWNATTGTLLAWPSTPTTPDWISWPVQLDAGIYDVDGFHPSLEAEPLGAPTDLNSLVAGNEVRLSWTTPLGTGRSARYVLRAGSSPGASDIADVELGGFYEPLLAATVPNGRYYVRVHARSDQGIGPPSNEVLIEVGPQPCRAAPVAPVGFGATGDGNQVTLFWQGVGGADGYVLEAGAAPGSAELASIGLGPIQSFSTFAPAGRYFVRVHAYNNCGTSGPSNEVQLRLGPPSAPGAPSVAVAGTTVTLTWTAPSDGTSTGYAVEAATEPGGPSIAVLQTSTQTSLQVVNVPAGSYFVRVRARNSAGTGPPSAEVRVDVGTQGTRERANQR